MYRQHITNNNKSIMNKTQPKTEPVISSDNNGGGKKAKKANFPQLLMEILNDEGNEDAIKWLPKGQGFIILKKDKFVDEILPRYLKQKCKYESFTRNLNRWGFHRVTRGTETAGSYYHNLFKRDQPWLVNQIKSNIPRHSCERHIIAKQQEFEQVNKKSVAVPLGFGDGIGGMMSNPPQPRLVDNTPRIKSSFVRECASILQQRQHRQIMMHPTQARDVMEQHTNKHCKLLQSEISERQRLLAIKRLQIEKLQIEQELARNGIIDPSFGDLSSFYDAQQQQQQLLPPIMMTTTTIAPQQAISSSLPIPLVRRRPGHQKNWVNFRASSA